MKLSIPMTRNETAFGWLLLVAQLVFLPELLVTANALFGFGLSNAELNFLMFSVNFVLTLAIFHRYLWQSALLSAAAFWRTLRSAFLGYLMYYGAALLLGITYALFFPDFSNVNDETIRALTGENYKLMSVCIVFLAPITEEVLYRGLIFRELHSKSRLAAYAFSALVFGAIHMVGYIGTAAPLTLILGFVQYLPAGLALAWAYEKADSIWAPILLHITVNQIAIASV